MHFLKLTTSVFVAMALASPAVLHAQQKNEINDCDRLAASPDDEQKPAAVAGVKWDDLNAGPAISACRNAVAIYPNNARFHYQYGRALHKDGYKNPAATAYRKAAELGSLSAYSNYGLLLQQGYEKGRNAKDALVLYEYAASKGSVQGRANAASILSTGGEGLLPDIPRAAVYLRQLADGGDEQAAEQVANFIEQGVLKASNTTEMLYRSLLAAKSGRFTSIFRLAYIYKASPISPDNIQKGSEYAWRAYKMTLTAPVDSEAGLIIYQRQAIGLVSYFEAAGAKGLPPNAEIAKMLKDFPSQITRLDMQMDCAGKETPGQLQIWQWSRNYSQIDNQVDWLRANRGCIVPPDVSASLNKIFKIAKDAGLSYPELVSYSLDAANKAKSNIQKQPMQQAMSTLPSAPEKVISQNAGPASKELTSGQIAGLGLTSVIAVAACWYWSDQCKDLAWEATKQGARELVKRRAD